jgi:hypothetical protein
MHICAKSNKIPGCRRSSPTRDQFPQKESIQEMAVAAYVIHCQHQCIPWLLITIYTHMRALGSGCMLPTYYTQKNKTSIWRVSTTCMLGCMHLPLYALMYGFPREQIPLLVTHIVIDCVRNWTHHTWNSECAMISPGPSSPHWSTPSGCIVGSRERLMRSLPLSCTRMTTLCRTQL